MVSPYALTRPGGVQGQVLGLARSLRVLGHEVTVMGPADEGDMFSPASDQVGEHYVWWSAVPRGSAPTDRWRLSHCRPTAAAPPSVRAQPRFRRGAPSRAAGTGHFLRPGVAVPCPMVGTYHRAGVSRWVPMLKPLAELVVGRRLQVRVAVSEAARETGERSGGGNFEVLFNGVDMERFASAVPVPDHRGAFPWCCSSGATRHGKGLGVLLDAFATVDRTAVLWVAGDGPAAEVLRRRSPRFGPGPVARHARRRGGGSSAWPGPICCAPPRGTASRSAWCCSRAWRRGVRWWPRTSRAIARPRAGTRCSYLPATRTPSPALSVVLADVDEGSGASSPEAHKAAEAHRAGVVDGRAGAALRGDLRAGHRRGGRGPAG